MALSPKNVTMSLDKSSLIQKSQSSPSIDWNAITKEAEMVKLKTEVSRLESLLEDSKHKASQKDVEYDLKMEGLKNEIEREKLKTTEAENQMKAYEKKVNDLNLQLDGARDQFGKEYEKYENKINQMNRDIVELRNQLNDCLASQESTEAHHNSVTIELENQVETLKIQLSQSDGQRQVLENHITSLKSELEQTIKLESELMEARTNIRFISEELQSYKDGVKLSSILEDELKELKELREKNVDLQRSNEILSDVHSKNLILEEKVIGLESQLKAANEKLLQSIQLDVESTELRNRLQKWEEVMGCDSPLRVSGHLSQLQANELQLRTELGQLSTQLNEFRTEKNRLETELQTTSHKLEEQNKTLNKMQKKCLLFAKERDSYKNLISSYEQDITLDYNKLNDNRVEQLEEVIKEYKTLLESFESELKQLRSEHKVEEYHKEISRLKDELVRSQELIAKLEKMQTIANDEPMAELSNVSDKYRVIHFNENPVSSEYKKYMEELKFFNEENERLKTRLQLLENGCDADVTRQLDEGIKTRQELEKLQQKLDSSEKRQQNIVDAFKRTSKEFREICYRLLGFRIDLLKQQKYRLSNIYSDSPEDCLMFECDSNNTINLLENEYSKKAKGLRGDGPLSGPTRLIPGVLGVAHSRPLQEANHCLIYYFIFYA